MKTSITFLLFMAIACVGIKWVVGQPDDQFLEAQQYCQKVHDKSWPDFHHVYAEQCHVDGTVDRAYIYGR